MTVTFTPTGSDAQTLVDDANRLFGVLQDLAISALEQTSPLFRADYPAVYPRGNANGVCVIGAFKSYDSVDDAAAALRDALLLRGSKGELKVTIGQTELTFPSATLPSVTKEEFSGVFLRMRYDFRVTELAEAEKEE